MRKSSGRKARVLPTPQEGRRYRWLVAVLAITAMLFVIFNIIPLVRLFDLAFQSWPRVLAGSSEGYIVGNFTRMFADPIFFKVLENTMAFAVLRVGLGMTIGLAIALAIERTKLFRAVYVAAWFSPFIKRSGLQPNGKQFPSECHGTSR